MNLDATKPLVRFVTLAPEGCDPMCLYVKCEKMTRYYAHCGLMGHVDLECGSGEFSEDELQFGDWILAGSDSLRAGMPRVHSMFGGKQGGQRPQEDRSGPGNRRRMRGHGGCLGGARDGLWREKKKEGEKKDDSVGSQKRGSMEAGLGEYLADSATSSPKPVHQTKEEDLCVHEQGVKGHPTAPALVCVT